MLNKLTAFVHTRAMILPGDHIICAVSGGADSVALLFGLYLLKEKMQFTLSAAHFNHRLRGDESDRDEAFVKEFCHRYDIPCYLGGGQVQPGKKGLEAAARDARYAFLRSLPGKVATAHTADDNAETILMHLVRGTGLRGLCGIAPESDGVIRPLLNATRADVEAFLAEYHLPHVEDSSNGGDAFQRNRLRHHVMPLLKAENPRLAENLTAMALSLQAEEELLEKLAQMEYTLRVSSLRQMDTALRVRILERFLKENGIPEPQRSHIAFMEDLVFSEKPSARADLPGGITVERCYDTLRAVLPMPECPQLRLTVPGECQWGSWRVRCLPAARIVNNANTITLSVRGDVVLRSRQAGDIMRLSGGTKSLKKIYIDRKIPASQRALIPVLADEEGVLGVPGIGANLDRIANDLPAVQFIFEENETLGGF